MAVSETTAVSGGKKSQAMSRVRRKTHAKRRRTAMKTTRLPSGVAAIKCVSASSAIDSAVCDALVPLLTAYAGLVESMKDDVVLRRARDAFTALGDAVRAADKRAAVTERLSAKIDAFSDMWAADNNGPPTTADLACMALAETLPTDTAASMRMRTPSPIAPSDGGSSPLRSAPADSASFTSGSTSTPVSVSVSAGTQTEELVWAPTTFVRRGTAMIDAYVKSGVSVAKTLRRESAKSQEFRHGWQAEGSDAMAQDEHNVILRATGSASAGVMLSDGSMYTSPRLVGPMHRSQTDGTINARRKVVPLKRVRATDTRVPRDDRGAGDDSDSMAHGVDMDGVCPPPRRPETPPHTTHPVPRKTRPAATFVAKKRRKSVADVLVARASAWSKQRAVKPKKRRAATATVARKAAAAAHTLTDWLSTVPARPRVAVSAVAVC